MASHCPVYLQKNKVNKLSYHIHAYLRSKESEKLVLTSTPKYASPSSTLSIASLKLETSSCTITAELYTSGCHIQELTASNVLEVSSPSINSSAKLVLLSSGKVAAEKHETLIIAYTIENPLCVCVCVRVCVHMC